MISHALGYRLPCICVTVCVCVCSGPLVEVCHCSDCGGGGGRSGVGGV